MSDFVSVIWDAAPWNSESSEWSLFRTDVSRKQLRETVEWLRKPGCPVEKVVMPRDVRVHKGHEPGTDLVEFREHDDYEVYASEFIRVDYILDDAPTIDLDSGIVRGNGIIIHPYYGPGDDDYGAMLSLDMDDYDAVRAQLNGDLGLDIASDIDEVADEHFALVLATHYWNSIRAPYLRYGGDYTGGVKRALQEALQTKYPEVLGLFNLYLED